MYILIFNNFYVISKTQNNTVNKYFQKNTTVNRFKKIYLLMAIEGGASQFFSQLGLSLEIFYKLLTSFYDFLKFIEIYKM